MRITMTSTGVCSAGEKILNRLFLYPRRKRLWSLKVAPFKYTNRAGHTFVLHPGQYIDQKIFIYGIYEDRFLNLLNRRFDTASIALDVGANIGNHSIFLADSFAKIHAFEPNPTALARLRQNISLNRLEGKIQVHPVALGSESGTAPFVEHNADNLGASRFVSADSAATEAFISQLPVQNGDEYVTSLKLTRIDFMKIDVEGWEPMVFEGLRRTIAKHRPIIAFEYHGQLSRLEDYEMIQSVLTDYHIMEIEYNSLGKLSLLQALRRLFDRFEAKLHPVGKPEKRTYENIIAFPNLKSIQRFSNQ